MSNIVVWVSKSGDSKYHRSKYCMIGGGVGLTGVKSITEKEARYEGFEPCPICKNVDGKKATE